MKKKENGKRKTIAQGIGENPFRKLLKTLKTRLIKDGIQIIYADKWYPTSKKCSNLKINKIMRWFFYIYYPLHLLVLGIIGLYI